MSSIRIESTEKVQRVDMFFVNPFDVVVKEELRGRCEPVSEEAIISMAESMLDNTQLQPVQCRKLEDHRLQLNLGFTRTAAARLIRTGFTRENGQHECDPRFTLKVTLVAANDEKAFINNIVENCHRNQTSDVDDAHNQNRLRERYGMSDAEIAKLYGYKSTQRIDRLKALLSAPTEVQDMVQNGTMSTPAAVELLQLPEEKRDAAIETAKTESTNGKVSAPAISRQVREHHLRDSDEASEPKTSSNGKSYKTKKKPLSLSEFRKFIQSELDDAVAGTSRRKLFETLSKFLAGERKLETVKKVVTELIGE